MKKAGGSLNTSFSEILSKRRTIMDENKMNNEAAELTEQTAVETAEEPKTEESEKPAKKEKKEKKPFKLPPKKILIPVIAGVALLLALAIILPVTLCSCSGVISSYYDVFDEDMPFVGSVSYNTRYTAFPELENYVIDSYTDEDGATVELLDEEFAVLVTMTSTGVISHKVLSMRSQKVIATFAEKNTVHEIRFVEGAPAFFVKKTVIDPEILFGDNVISVSYMLYDAAGNCVVTSDNKEMPYALADMVIYDYAAYTYDHSGVISKKCDVPEYLLLEKCFYWNDTYLYVADSHNGYTVYDRDFNSISYWCAPGYDMDGCDMYVLNNLNVLVQYKVIMDNDAEDFDYVINNDDYLNLKIDLETFIVDVETGEAEELEDFNYVIGGLMSKEAMLRDSEDEEAEDYFKFENLITLIPIIERHLDDSHAATELVMMDDDGELGDSVKYVDYQTAGLPSRIDEDLFTVGLLTGQTAIIKEDGKIVHKLDKSYRIVDKYIVGTQAIYNFDLEKVYDLRANKGTVMGIVDNTVYINVKTSVGYDVVAFRNGGLKTLYSFNAESPSGDVFQLIEDAHCYMIYKAGSGEFTYYNSEDENITNSGKLLRLRHASFSHSAYLMWNDDAEITYCIFTNTAE
jgi:hypothetical protein